MGSNLWEETLHDMVLQCCMEIAEIVAKRIYSWKVTKLTPPPDDCEKVVNEAKEDVLKKLPYIQKVAEQQGKRFIVGDTVSECMCSNPIEIDCSHMHVTIFGIHVLTI